MREPGSAQDQQDATAIDAILDQLLDPSRPEPGPSKERHQRVANLLCLRGLDATLKAGTGDKNLMAFYPEVLLKPPSATLRRYWHGPEQLPAGCFRRGEKRRACVEDKEAKRCKLELPGTKRETLLHCRSDTGSQGWVMLHLLYNSIGILGSYWWDECHKRWNSVRHAATKAGVSNLLYCMVIAMTFTLGPFNSNANHFRFVQTAQHFFATYTSSSELFMLFYARIRKEMGFLEDEFGSDDSVQRVWTAAKEAKVFHKKHARVKLAVWFGVFEAFEEDWQCYSGCVAMIVVYMCLQIGKLSRKELLRLVDCEFSEGLLSAAAAEGVIEPMAPDVARTVAASNEELEATRKRTKGTLHCAAMTLGNMRNMAIFEGMAALAGVCRLSSGNMIRDMKTRRGSARLLEDRSQGFWGEELGELVRVSTRQCTWWRMGIVDPVFPGTEMDGYQEVLLFYWRFKCALLGERLLHRLPYVWSLPHYGVLLQHRDLDVRNKCLRTLKDWYEALEALESEAVTNPIAAGLMKDCWWTVQQWPRRVLIRCAEMDFEEVPEMVLQQYKEYVQCMVLTKAVEDGNHEIRVEANKREGDKISRAEKYSALVRSTVLDDSDRKRVVVTEAAKTYAEQVGVSSDFFNPERYECSVPVDELDVLTNAESRWSSPSPENLSQAPLLWRLCVRKKGEGFGWVSRLWGNLLPAMGTMLRSNDGRSCGVVVSTGRGGVLLWHTTIVKLQDDFYLELMDLVAGRECWSHVTIEDVDEWKAIDVEVVSPIMYCEKRMLAGEVGALPDRLAFRRSAHVLPLMEHAARRAFVGLRKPQLFEVARILGVQVRQSANERTLVRTVVEKALENVDDVDIDEIVELRKYHGDRQLPTEMDNPENVQHLREVINETDQREIIEDVQRIAARAQEAREARGRAQERRAASSGASGPGGAKSSGAAAAAPVGIVSAGAVAPLGNGDVGAAVAVVLRKPQRSPGVASWDEEMIRGFCPPTDAKIVITHETARCSRWRARYPSGGACSFQYGGYLSEDHAVFRLISFLWSQHEVHNPDAVCPWGLSSPAA